MIDRYTNKIKIVETQKLLEPMVAFQIKKILYRCMAILCMGLLPRVANAQFTILTNETLVNTTTTGEQWGYWWSTRTIAVQPDGGYIVVWIDNNGLDGSTEGIFGQRFNATGAKVGSEFQVNTTSTGQQFSPTIAVTPDGSFIVAWEGPGNSIDIFAQRFSKDGVKIRGEFLLNTTLSGNQRYPELQFYPDGTWVAGFVDGAQTVLQRFDTDDRTIGQETRISSGTGAVVLDGLCVRQDNSILLTWTSGGDIYGQFFDPNLQPIGSQTRINTYLTGTQEYSIPRVYGDGSFIVVWQSAGQDGSGMGIYGRRYDKNFNPLGGEFIITTNTINDQFEPQIAVESSGRFIIAWSDNNNRDGGGGSASLAGPGASVWMREFDNNGNPVGVETMVNQSTIGYQAYPVIDMNASGRFVIGFEGNGTQIGQIDSYGVFARAYQLSQAGTTSISVTPSATVSSDLVTVTMTLTAPSNIANVIPNPLTFSGTNGVFATLVGGPTPASATVGVTPTTFTWTYRTTAQDDPGILTFGGNARNNAGIIFPYAPANSINVKPALFLSDLTAPNLINDSNNPDASPQVFTIGAKLTNAGLNTLTNVELYLGDGVTPGVFPMTTMTLAQTNNTYQGSFALQPMAGIADCTRPMVNLGPSKSIIAGGIDFDGNSIINSLDNGTLSNGKKVINGRIDVNLDGIVNASDNIPLPPGVFYGYREPAIISGYVDTNRDGVINASDIGTYGGETCNVYWQVRYQVKDAFGQPTFGNCGDFIDDLRYKWVVWGTGQDGSGVTRTDEVNEFAKVRCELSAAANKITPNPGGYISGGPPRVIAGAVDINSDGVITVADNGTYYAKPVIAGKIDMNNSGTITTADNGTLNGFPVIAGFIDVNSSGTISAADDGILLQVGQKFSITVNNATFGSVGNGFDENRDNLWDIDMWHQPIGKTDWPTNSFRLIDIQSDVTGSGGSNPLNGITTHYNNEPYLSRLIGSLNGTFNATYTYTFMAIGSGNSFITPYQEAASGTNNVKYNGDYGSGVNLIMGLPGLILTKTGTPLSTRTCDTITWNMNYQNVSSTSVGDPNSGNGVFVEDILPANTTFVANSATCGTYACSIYYSTDNGSSWSVTQPPAANVNGVRWYIEQAIPANSTDALSFKTTIKNCPLNGSSITNQAAIKLGIGPPISTATASVTVSNPAPVISTCAVTRNIVGCNTSAITDLVFSTTTVASSQAVFQNATNQGVASDDCGITAVTYRDVATGSCPIVVTRTWVMTDACNNTATCTQTINIMDNVLPNITCVANQSKNTNTGVCTYTAVGTEFNPVSATDNCGVKTLTYALTGQTTGSGSNSLTGIIFNKGTSTVTWTVTDSCNNTRTCSFNVLVTDNILPNINCPANITATSSAACTRIITIPTITPTDNCGISTLTWTMTGATTASGSGQIGTYTFSRGVTNVTYTVTDVNSNVNTCTFTVTVPLAVVANITAQNNVTCFGTATGNATVTASNGTAPYSYAWNTTPLQTGATATGLVPGTYNATVTDNNGCTTTTTTAATISQPAAIAISAQPANITECISGTLALNVTVTGGTGGYVYQWERASAIGGPFSPISGATASSYTPLSTTSGTKYYRVIVNQTDRACSDVISTVATVIITSPPSVTINTGLTTICVGAAVTLTASPAGGAGTCSLQWQNSPDGTTWTSISGATNTSYTTIILSLTTRYRATYTCTASGCCN